MKRIVRPLIMAAALSSTLGSRFVAAQAFDAPSRSEHVAVDDGVVTLAPTLHGRYNPGVAHDRVNGRIFLFGGVGEQTPHGLSDVWIRGVSGGVWKRVRPSGTVPPGRQPGATVYDPVRNRLIVFGGIADGGALFGDVWALSLSGAPQWTKLTPSGTGPSARYGMGAVYDAPRDRIVLFGGRDNTNHDDVYALSLDPSPAWTPLEVAGTPPPARYQPAAIYDPIGSRAIFYGGFGSGSFTDTWALSLDDPAWTQLATTGTPASAAYGIYDDVRHRLVVYQGDASTDVWAMSLTDLHWQSLPAIGTAPNRPGCAVLPDPASDGLLTFGGFGSPYYSDTWRYSFTDGSWTRLEEGEPLLPGLGPAPWTVRDSRRDRMLVMLGGRVWALTFDEFVWSPLFPTGAPPVGWTGYSAVYDRIGDRVLFFGGTTSSGLIQETWALDLSGTPQWTQLSPAGTPPSARQNHAAIVDTLDDRMVIFGGTGASGASNDVWTLSLSGPPVWSALTPSGTPPTPQDARGLYDEGANRMLVMSRSSHVVQALTLGATPAWSPTTSTAGSLGFYDGAQYRGVAAEQGIGHAFYGAFDLITNQYGSLSPTGRVVEAPVATMLDPNRHRMVMFGDSHCSGLGGCTSTNATFLWSFPPGPVTVEPSAIDLGASAMTSIDPSPARGPQRITFRIAPGDRARMIEVYSVDGRRVWSKPLKPGTSGAIIWDGLTSRGGTAPAAVYFARLTTDRGISSRHFVRL